jgi:hypothetical protein
MMRHAKRDEEAGGPGLGVLETRKRTRRGPDGKVVTRPTKKQAKTAAVSRSPFAAGSSIPSSHSSCGSMSATSENQRMEVESMTTLGTDGDAVLHKNPVRRHADHTPHGAPVSPPRSTHDSHASVNVDETLMETCDAVTASEPLLAPMVPGGPYEPYVEPIPGQFDAGDGSWQNWGGLDEIYDDVNLDTGMYSHWSIPIDDDLEDLF